MHEIRWYKIRWYKKGDKFFIAPFVTLFPRHLQLLLIPCTIRQIQIDKRLVWYARFLALFLKKINRFIVNVNRYLLFQPFNIRISSPIAKIIFFFHIYAPFKNRHTASLHLRLLSSRK